MLVPELIRRKRDGGELSEEEIAFLGDSGPAPRPPVLEVLC